MRQALTSTDSDDGSLKNKIEEEYVKEDFDDTDSLNKKELKQKKS